MFDNVQKAADFMRQKREGEVPSSSKEGDC